MRDAMFAIKQRSAAMGHCGNDELQVGANYARRTPDWRLVNLNLQSIASATALVQPVPALHARWFDTCKPKYGVDAMSQLAIKFGRHDQHANRACAMRSSCSVQSVRILQPQRPSGANSVYLGTSV
jgi:hypothetical protein